MRLDILFVVLLALVWAVVLVPSIFRSRLGSSPADAVRRFERSMGILASTRRGGTPGRWVMVPKRDGTLDRRRQLVVRRRRQAFERLIIAAGATLILGIPSALRWVWLVHLAVDGILVGYVLWLRNQKMAERRLRERVVDITPVEEGEPQADAEDLGGSYISQIG